MKSTGRRLGALTVPVILLAGAAFALPGLARARPLPGTPISPAIVRILRLPPAQQPGGIAIDRQGTMYVSLLRQGQILRVTPGGSRSVAAALPPGTLALALAAGPPGSLYAAAAGRGGSGVWRIQPGGGRPLRVLRLPGIPGGLALDAAGNLYVSDATGGAIYRRDTRGTVTRWAASPLLAGTAGNGPCGSPYPAGLAPGASGLAVAGGELLAANASRGTIVRIPVRPDGSAGTAALLAGPDCRLWGAAGLALDARGTLYVAANAAEDVVRASPDGTLQALAARAAGDPLASPSGLAFTPGWRDRSQLCILNSALLQHAQGAGVVMLSLGVPGRALP